jgi:predicted metalloprotease with PDZ domain
MKINKNVALSDSGFVFNPATGDSFSTNPIGIEIFKLLKEGKSEKEIKAAVMKAYEVDASTLERDFEDFVNMLQKFKLSE